jgi:hypothetical protein
MFVPYLLMRGRDLGWSTRLFAATTYAVGLVTVVLACAETGSHSSRARVSSCCKPQTAVVGSHRSHPGLLARPTRIVRDRLEYTISGTVRLPGAD